MNIILTKKCNELSSSDFLRGCDNNDASVRCSDIRENFCYRFQFVVIFVL